MVAHHELMDGRLHVYKRDNSRYWQCSAFLSGRNHRVSTKEESLAHAKDFAEDWFLDLKGKSRRGEIKGGKTFQHAATQWLREIEVLTAGERSPSYVSQNETHLRVHLLPFFGKKALSEITPGLVQEYRINRVKNGVHPKTGKPHRPSRSTMHKEIVCLRQVLKAANRHGWLAYLPDISDPVRASGKVSHRAWFSPDEYKKLYEATGERAGKPAKKRWKWSCEQLHDYVLFMANTGLRPDEAGRLEFRDVQIMEGEGGGKDILLIEVRGKRGVGYCKSTPMAVRPFERLQNRLRTVVDGEPGEGRRSVAADSTGKWRIDPAARSKRVERIKPRPTDRVFPQAHVNLFNRVLDDLGLKFDRDGNRRASYSLRHTYICFRLTEGADIYQIAKNCRTSVEMIEKYYASHLQNTLDAAAINVMKPRKRVRKPKSTEISEE
jgi:integrase